MKTKETIKECLLAIIKDIRDEEGWDLKTNSFVLQWTYDEEPDVKFTLYIGDHDSIEDEGTTH